MTTMFRNGKLIPAATSESSTGPVNPNPSKGKVLSAEYAAAFHAFISSGGNNQSAALYEGQGSSGGYLVPVEVAGQVVALAPQALGVRALATLIPTTNDIRIPRQTTFSMASAKAESGTTANSFTESEPAFDSFTLSAYMAGVYQKLSFELVQDVAAFQAFCVSDMLNGQSQYEEGTYISGSGVGMAQGLLGNVDAGVAAAVQDASGNLVSLDSVLDLIATLKAQYHAGAAFLMARPTSVLIRKAQRQANLFEPVFTSSNGVDYLYGYPVTYSGAMPAAVPGSSPILFGDFKQGYLVGDRGGSGTNVKILDQPFALQGQVALLAYRRSDGRVRRSEAIKQYTLHS